MDEICAVVTAKRTLYTMSRPSKEYWLVAHNGKGVAHVVAMTPELCCMTGLGALEKYDTQVAAETRASAFGWQPEESVLGKG
jgi:hypothetical protein